jgi:hypothetical protein
LAKAVFDEVIQFLERLQSEAINYSLSTIRPKALLVSVTVPGQRWEIEFFVDGTVEIEKFVSDGTIFDNRALDELLDQFGAQSG